MSEHCGEAGSVLMTAFRRPPGIGSGFKGFLGGFYPIVLSVLCLKSPINKQTTKPPPECCGMLWVLFRGRMNRSNQNGYLIIQDQDLAC